MRPILALGVLALSLQLAAAAADAAGRKAAPASVAVATSADAEAETRRLTTWFDAKYEEFLRFSPVQMTFLGRKDLQDRLDDPSEASEAAQVAWRKAAAAELAAGFDRAKLTGEGQLSWDLWMAQADDAAEDFRMRGHVYLFNQMMGAQAQLPTLMIGFHKVDDEADYLAYVKRLEAFPSYFDTLLAQAKARAAAGVRAPRFAYEGVIEQSRKVVTGAPFGAGADSALWADAQAKAAALRTAGKIDAAREAQLVALARGALVDDVQPAYARIIAWAEGDLGKAAVNPAGVGTTQPDGAAYYASRLRRSTTTDLTAEQIHRIGLDEVARIHADMVALKDEVGFEGDLKAFFHFIATDPRFKYPDTDAGRQAYLDDATAAIANIEKELPAYFGLLPKADLVVRRVEAFREQPGSAQHYYPGTPDGSRPGIYYAHLSDMNAMPKPELEVIAYHEGLPGHHLQISIAQELVGMPVFRTQADSTAYAEGWGLYSEWLAKEMPNTYRDPYSRYGQMSSELWRAVRLVVDTGMHAKGWTEQQAVDYFEANTAVAGQAVRAEVQRYLTWPGQATAYKIGMIRIQALRRKAETQLGDRFDIRGFHDAVLGGGALPLSLLERRVDQWIASRKPG